VTAARRTENVPPASTRTVLRLVAGTMARVGASKGKPKIGDAHLVMRAAREAAQAQAIELRRASGAPLADDDDDGILRGINAACDAFGFRSLGDLEDARALRALRDALRRCAAAPRAASRARRALGAVDRGLPEVGIPDRLDTLADALAEEIESCDPWSLMLAVVAQCADDTHGILWWGRRPTDRELALVAVLCGWVSDAWASSAGEAMTTSVALKKATDAARTARRDLGIALAEAAKRGRPKTRGQRP